MAELTTYGMQEVLSYPFRDPKWKSKLVVGMLLTLAGIFVPVIPTLFVTGYGYQIMYRLIVEHGELYLPDWDDWGKLFSDGWRLFAVSFVYSLPSILTMIVGIVLYFLSFIVIAMTGDSTDAGSTFLILFGMGAFFLSIALCMLLGMACWIVLPPAMGHAVSNGSFSAGFDFSSWWKVFKANPGGFFLAVIVMMGLAGILYFLIQIAYMTIVLMCLMFILPAVISFYVMLIGFPLIALAYREGVDRLAGKPTASSAAEPAETPSKPRARRTRARE